MGLGDGFCMGSCLQVNSNTRTKPRAPISASLRHRALPAGSFNQYSATGQFSNSKTHCTAIHVEARHFKHDCKNACHGSFITAGNRTKLNRHKVLRPPFTHQRPLIIPPGR